MTQLDPVRLANLVDHALDARAENLAPGAALRLFNGFYEGCPELVADLYDHSLVLFGYGTQMEENRWMMQTAQQIILQRLPWVDCVIHKYRGSDVEEDRRGRIVFGSTSAQSVQENGVWYALNVLLNQDASLYLDTRNLRVWLKEYSQKRSILNTFAYTGSLGVAALAGGAEKVVQVDRNERFLLVARQSARLNGMPDQKMELRKVDFFSAVAHAKLAHEFFDCVIVDPPYFSSTEKGTVQLAQQSTQVINKVRPLVKDGGRLVVINNALFLSGLDFMRSLETLCTDGYLKIEQIIPVPADFTGYPATILAQPPVDPAPFNHPTKIIVISVRRKL
jgi:23S rRNA (cytosine1962-C5)-methyltransferase